MKIAIKFKENIPKVVLIFSKIIQNKNLFLKNTISKVEDNLALLHYSAISSVLFNETKTKNNEFKLFK
jgi:hypothetical protein